MAVGNEGKNHVLETVGERFDTVRELMEKELETEVDSQRLITAGKILEALNEFAAKLGIDLPKETTFGMNEADREEMRAKLNMPLTENDYLTDTGIAILHTKGISTWRDCVGKDWIAFFGDDAADIAKKIHSDGLIEDILLQNPDARNNQLFWTQMLAKNIESAFKEATSYNLKSRFHPSILK